MFHIHSFTTRSVFILVSLVFAIVLTACQPLQPVAPDSATSDLDENGTAESGIAEINGIQIYYEIHGEGEPLILLHGGLGNSDYWSEQIPVFAQHYRVIAMDSRGHGRSSFDETPIGYDLMMSDVLALMDYLGVEKADLLGWSDGGIIGLDLAINHPERMNRIVAYGANYIPEGVREDVGENATFSAYIEKAAADYQKLSPAPERWDEFLNNIGNMWATEPNFTPEQLGAITTPILVLDGENEEAIKTEHTIDMAGLIPGAELILIPETGHFAMWEKTEEFNQIVLDYLAQK
ncbi:MAG: alpha/beta hydrolase [Caldilineaceae bacterium]